MELLRCITVSSLLMPLIRSRVSGGGFTSPTTSSTADAHELRNLKPMASTDQRDGHRCMHPMIYLRTGHGTGALFESL